MAKKKKKSQDSKKRTKNKSILEYEIYKIIESSLNAAIDTAMKNIFKNF